MEKPSPCSISLFSRISSLVKQPKSAAISAIGDLNIPSDPKGCKKDVKKDEKQKPKRMRKNANAKKCLGSLGTSSCFVPQGSQAEPWRRKRSPWENDFPLLLTTLSTSNASGSNGSTIDAIGHNSTCFHLFPGDLMRFDAS